MDLIVSSLFLHFNLVYQQFLTAYKLCSHYVLFIVYLWMIYMNEHLVR